MPVDYLVYFCDSNEVDSDQLVLHTWKGQRLSLRKRRMDTILILSNYVTKQVFGLCRLRFWDGTQSCLKLISSPDVHGPELYHIGIREYVPFPEPINYDTIKMLLNVPDIKGASNIWKRARNCKAIFCSGSDCSPVLNEYKRLLQNINPIL